MLKKLLFCILFIFAMFNTGVSFALGPGTTGATFLKFGVGAKQVAMGEASVASTDDVNSIYWNPAGLANIENRQISLMHNEWFMGIRYEYLAYCQPMFGGVGGIAGTLLWIDGIERRISDTLASDGYIPARDIALTVSYSKKIIENINAGANVKIISEQLDDVISTGFAADIGMLIKLPEDRWTAGIMVQNLGYMPPFISDQLLLPINLKAGLANKYNPDEFSVSEVVFSMDLNYGFIDSVWSVGTGIDYKINAIHML